MNTKKLVLAGAVAAVGLLGFATVGLAVAQTGGGPSPTPAATAAGPHGHMGDHGAMMGHTSQTHDQVHDAVAKALGITVDELKADLEAGKTIPDIAQEKGVDMTAVTAAMQAAHPEGHGTGMMGDAATHADCPGM